MSIFLKKIKTKTERTVIIGFKKWNTGEASK